jgi:dTDP-4-dehydrorhamnose reductase
VKVLVIGRAGQLAAELRRATWPVRTRVEALGRAECDIADPSATEAALAAADPDLVVNAAAYTAVDRAEAEPELAFAVNGAGVRHLAAAAARREIPIIHLSTDYVFDGRSRRPWREDDETNPLGVYGRSKLEGERALASVAERHVILRTSWVFASHGQNFVRTMLRLGRERDTLKIVADQVGSPTPATDLARVVVEIATALAAGKPCFGTYHYAGAGPVSWFDFAAAIFDLAHDLVPRRPHLQPISTAAFGAAAPRPAYSVLDCSKIERQLGIGAAPWRAGLASVLDEIGREAASGPARGATRP